jgi:hypothetical protein
VASAQHKAEHAPLDASAVNFRAGLDAHCDDPRQNRNRYCLLLFAFINVLIRMADRDSAIDNIAVVWIIQRIGEI